MHVRIQKILSEAMILLPAHPASFAHKFLFPRVLASPGCNSIPDLSLKTFGLISLQLGLIDI